MRSDLRLEDDQGVVLEARQTDPDTVRLYGCAGGPGLTREHVKALTAWLDDGGSAVSQHEADRLRRELDLVGNDVAQLLDALKGAWWLEAAAAYGRLSDWIGRHS